jgi:DNA-binding transcriptional ArsR family regulator
MLAITGSRSRAAILALLFGDHAVPMSLMELARAAGVRHSAVRRELSALLAAGVIRTWGAGGPRPNYVADRAFPAAVELSRVVCLLSGTAARLREAAAAVDVRALVWIHGPYAELPAANAKLRIAAISWQRRALRSALESAAATDPRRPPVVDVLSIAEWVTRSQRRDMRLLAIRRAQRLWILGDGAQLRLHERGELTSRETFKRAIANWREELSDEWDDDYDPDRT